MHKPVVIIGRTNVGKSSLFNRLLGRRRALVHNVPGTTRDRNEAPISWNGREFILIDTGGWAHDDVIFSAKVKTQLEAAVDKAALVILLVDGKNGLHPLDAELAKFVRRQNKPSMLTVNKIDTAKDEVKLADFYKLGIDDIIGISAEQGRNINEFLDRIVSRLGPALPAEPEPQPIRMILVGKPNVGKSSLINALIREERSIVHDIPGTTREALDVPFTWNGQDYILIDTPGLHRKRKYKDDMDYLSTLSAEHAVERSDVAVLVMDVSQGVGETEAKIAELILRYRKACLLVLNKWDLVEEREKAAKSFERTLGLKLPFLQWSKVLLVSAKTGQRTEKIFGEVQAIYKEYSRIVPHDTLKETIRSAETRKPLSRHGKVLRIRGVEQSGAQPPTFSFSVNDIELVHFSYRRYLENALRRAFGFTGTPLVLRFHRENEPRKGKQ